MSELEWKRFDAKSGGTDYEAPGFFISDDLDGGGWFLWMDKNKTKTLEEAQSLAQQLQDVLDGTARSKVLAEVAEALENDVDIQEDFDDPGTWWVELGHVIELVHSLERGKE